MGSITTGYSTTALIIEAYVYEAADYVGIDLDHETVALVGAAGSVCSTVAQLLMKQGRAKKLLLIDREQRFPTLERLAKDCTDGIASISTNLEQDLSEASVVITATTDPRSIIKRKMLGDSVVVIDDSQPRNTNYVELKEAIASGQLLVLDVLAKVPGLNLDFHYGLLPENPEITFTCLAEVVALHLAGKKGSLVGPVTDEHLSMMRHLLQEAGITRAPFTSFMQIVTEEDLNLFRERRQPISR